MVDDVTHGKRRSARWRRLPDETHDYSRSHLGRGEDYDEGFAALPLRSLMSTMEEAVIRELAGRTAARSVLDFACGTGRIAEVVVTALPAARLVGVDIAESMLSVARERVPSGEWIHADVSELHSLVAGESFDLVTAFRFFPNADPALRAAAVTAVADAVRPGGFVLLNNHRNFWSGSYLARRLPSGAPAPGALNRQVVGPFLERGFAVVARRSLGVTPQSDERAYGLPLSWATRMERLNARVLSSRHTIGTNTIWLLQKHGLSTRVA
ncbi:MAG: N-methyltransferase [Nocardioides sp.]|jgi:SAM-dependent methyltransferase|nr:N-methyltransferase [Nocardioides sp.]